MIGSPNRIYEDFHAFGCSEDIKANLLSKAARSFIESC